MRHLIREYHIDPWQVDCGMPELRAMLIIDSETNQYENEQAKQAARG